MKSKLILFSTVLMSTLFSFGQYDIDSTLLNFIAGVDSTYLYDKDGNKEWYFIQKDIYCFQIMGDGEYTDPLGGAVDEQMYWNTATSRFNEIRFDPTSTWLDRASMVEYITELPNYKRSAFALSKNSSSDYTAKEYYRSDDQIMVTFNDPLLSAGAIDTFATNYGLYIVHAPNPALNNSVSWTYTFRMLAPQGQTQDMVSILLAQIINENEEDLVKLAEPNLYATYPLACAPTTEVGAMVGDIDGTWHIRNNGGLVWSGYSGVADADADICECWGEGYTGNNVKVGVIDFGGIEFSHDDFAGTDINEVYVAPTSTDVTGDIYLDETYGHGMQVTGTIAATPNNSGPDGLGFRYAVGAAYNAEVKPYLVQSFFEGEIEVSNAQISQSIMEAIFNGMDVVNMSFKTDAGFGSIELNINNGTAIGRPHDGDAYWGIVFVAGTGNDNLEGSHFPANLPNVIGVGWTNPEDYRSAYDSPAPSGGSWTTNPYQGSTFGPPEFNYDVVAPGELIMTTNLSTTGGGEYSLANGASISTPIVASIAAILLDKDVSLDYEEVRDLIRQGAEQVNTGTYDYYTYGGSPGYNDEMFYGRVSCINSLNSILSVSDEAEITELTVFREDLNNYTVFIPAIEENQSYDVFDMSGRILTSSVIAAGSTELSIDLSTFTSGMYILRLRNGEKSSATTKLLK